MLYNLLSNIAAGLQIDRSAAAQLIAALAAATIGIAATLAAFLSARATARSVREMRAARMQASKAVIGVPPDTRLVFTWERGRSRPEFKIAETEDKRPAIEITNIGAGPALNISFSSQDAPVGSEAPISIEQIRKLFSAADISVYKANNGFEFRDRRFDKRKPIRMFSDILESTAWAENCAIGQSKKLGVNHLLLEGFILRCFSALTEGYSWYAPYKLRYETMSGEDIAKEYNLLMTSNTPVFTIAEPVVQYDEVVHWSKFEIAIGIYISERSDEPSLLTELGYRLRGWREKRLAPFRKVGNRAAARIRNLILHGGKAPERFQIGDRVIFKPDADWAIMEDGKEEVRPEAQPIDTEHWKKAGPEPEEAEAVSGESDASDRPPSPARPDAPMKPAKAKAGSGSKHPARKQ